jgi:ribokinase
MARILVSGLINIETTVEIAGFPLPYAPVHYLSFGINSSVSGVGFNVSKALKTLGHDVRFLSLIGDDLAGGAVRATLAQERIADDLVLSALPTTAQSVILFDPSGKRQIHVDLKNIQEQVYPEERFDAALTGCDAAVLCNINFSRPFLRRARAAGRLVATDVHTVSQLDDDYNQDFMAAADVLFMNDERLPMPPEAWAAEIMARYAPQVLVIGLGAQGALLAVQRDQFVGRFPAASVRPVVSTIGAGDALFSAFVHGFVRTGDPYHALRQAIVFAAYKIGVTSAADGFLDQTALDRLYQETLD